MQTYRCQILIAVSGLDHIKNVSLYILLYPLPDTEETWGTDQQACLKSLSLVNLLPVYRALHWYTRA